MPPVRAGICFNTIWVGEYANLSNSEKEDNVFTVTEDF
tara:strand:- start:2030 stop:2143 length:114 start_codon:yes stop_codon:yes gene_type:complete